MKKHYIIVCLGILFLSYNSHLQVFESQAATSQLVENQKEENPLLKFVPSDTVFFSGSAQIFSLKDYPLFLFDAFNEIPLKQGDKEFLSKELNFLHELFLDVKNAVQKSKLSQRDANKENLIIQKHLGLSENMAIAMYFMGGTPVLKFFLDNDQAFLTVLKKAEIKAGFHHHLLQLGPLQYRAYPITEHLKLAVSIQSLNEKQKFVTLTLLNDSLTEKQKKLIFGLKLPEHSISSTTQIQSIQQKNQYLPFLISFLDFQALAKSLYQENNNPWIEILGEKQHFISNLHASGCAKDVQAITEEMPRIVAGYKQYQVHGERVVVDVETLLELKNQNVRAELKRLRGFIPDYVRNGAEDKILGVGLGVNLSQLNPLFFYISKIFRENSFHCEAFKKLQQDIAKFNPAMLGLIAGFVDGVHGLSFSLLDINFSEPIFTEKPLQTKSLLSAIKPSILMTLSAEEPLKVWQMLSSLNSVSNRNTALFLPSAVPKKFNLSVLNAPTYDLFVVLKGEHLIFYSGDKAKMISELLGNEKITPNGFFKSTINYTKMTSALKKGQQFYASQKGQKLMPVEANLYFDETISMLSKFSGTLGFHSDFVDSGWINNFNVNISFNNGHSTESHSH